MFNSKHYVPILKWKRAEQGALIALAEDCKINITPMIQFVMPRPKESEEFQDVILRFKEDVIKKIPDKVIEVWGNAPVFIDVSLLFTVPLKANSLKYIVQAGNKLGGNFIPVIHLNDDIEIKRVAFLLAKEKGLCLRLITSDFADLNKLKQDISKLLSSAGLKERDVDILVDIKETDSDANKYIRYLNASQDIPNLLSWRTYIFAAGSFPKDLTGCKFDEENLLSRIDWMSWKKNTANPKFKRKPTFADYAIQNPIYDEKAQFFPPTSSIKYTLENEWLIMKGQKQRFELYLASAAELVKDERFYGENFSDGDKYISEKAKHFPIYVKNPAVKGTGSTETWLKAGINHHLTVVADQIANLL